MLQYLGPLLQVIFHLGNIFNWIFRRDSNNQDSEVSVSELPDIEQTLYQIAHDVVLNMNLVGAKIETLDYDKVTLRSRAYFVEPQYLDIPVGLSDQKQIDECERQVRSIERTISHVVGRDVSMKGPDAKVDINDEQSGRLMGMRAFKSPSGILVDVELFTAFSPGLSERARPAMRNLQNRLGIKEVAAVPLFTRTEVSSQRYLGTLLVAAARHLTIVLQIHP